MSQKVPPNVDPDLAAEFRHFQELAAALPHGDLRMDLPKGARIKIEHGTWKVKWRKYQLFVGPLSEDEYRGQLDHFSQPAIGQYAHLYSITVTSVTFGRVRGVKQVRIVREVGSKSILYALEVAHGFAHAGILRCGIDWDESDCEELLSSVEIVKR